MKVKVIANYYDKQLKKDMVKGAEFEVDEDRATVLIGAGVCDSVTTTKKGSSKKEA